MTTTTNHAPFVWMEVNEANAGMDFLSGQFQTKEDAVAAFDRAFRPGYEAAGYPEFLESCVVAIKNDDGTTKEVYEITSVKPLTFRKLVATDGGKSFHAVGDK
jgi:hypothetical protein